MGTSLPAAFETAQTDANSRDCQIREIAAAARKGSIQSLICDRDRVHGRGRAPT